jgi:hypothetical protein
MSAADIAISWYANDTRAAVTDAQGRKWWVAPDGQGAYSAVCDETGSMLVAPTADDVLRSVLGEHAHLMGVAR